MRSIFTEFNNSMQNIRGNFYISFLSINFINDNRPFSSDITINAHISNNTISSNTLNNIPPTMHEYRNSIRRHFLNDMIIAYEKYCGLMYVSHNNNQTRTDPSIINDRRPFAPRFENISQVFSNNDRTFLVQLRRLRNSIVHYNGKYTITNTLNYTFGTQTYNSVGHEGENIIIQWDTLLWIYNHLLEIVNRGNSNYFTHYVED